MNKKSIISLILNLCAIALFVSAIVVFSSGGKTTVGTTLLCSGFVFLNLGIFLTRREK